MKINQNYWGCWQGNDPAGYSILMVLQARSHPQHFKAYNMQNLNETTQRLISDQFDGSLDQVSSRLESAIRFFSTNMAAPEGELQHLQFQNSIESLYLVNDILQRLDRD